MSFKVFKVFSKFYKIAMILPIFIIIYTTASCVSEGVNLESLKQVQIIFRHGERMPEYPYPNNPYGIEDYGQLWEQLSTQGKSEAYAVGRYLRYRYEDFLSKDYIPGEIHALTSDIDRTIMSLQLALGGLYPTENGTDWNPLLKWQPVPFRTINYQHNNVISVVECPNFQTFLSKLVNSVEFSKNIYRTFEQNNVENLYKNLSEGSGQSIKDLVDLGTVFEKVYAEESFNLLPVWLHPIIHTPIFEYLYNLSYIVKTFTPQLQRLRGGPLLYHLIKNLNNYFNPNATLHKPKSHSGFWGTKMFIISGHDTTIINFLNTLRIFEAQRVNFASIVFLELHENSERKHFVNILLKNVSDFNVQPVKLILPGCEFDCPVEYFFDIVNPLMLDPLEWDLECGLKSESGWYLTIPTIIIGFASVCVLIVFIATVFTLFKGKRRETTEEHSYRELKKAIYMKINYNTLSN